MATFKPRLTRPEAGNKYYITKGAGGWSPCIEGNPTDKDCNALPNCVGYALGRFNEIGGYGYCKYAQSTNAENFVEACKAQGLKIGATPKLGAIVVWQKGATLSGSDGAGHVAVVEQINADGSIVTSESGWKSSPFWTTKRTNSNGRWGAGSAYTFRGFIYQPTEYSGATDKNVGGNTTTGSGTTSDGKLTVDGLWGMATTKRLQEIFGLEKTGEIKNQWMAYKTPNPGLRSGWCWEEKPNRKGDPLIKDLQKWAGMPAAAQDGEIGPATIKALQRKLGTVADGRISGGTNGSAMVKALQKWANAQK